MMENKQNKEVISIVFPMSSSQRPPGMQGGFIAHCTKEDAWWFPRYIISVTSTGDKLSMTHYRCLPGGLWAKGIDTFLEDKCYRKSEGRPKSRREVLKVPWVGEYLVLNG